MDYERCCVLGARADWCILQSREWKASLSAPPAVRDENEMIDIVAVRHANSEIPSILSRLNWRGRGDSYLTFAISSLVDY